MTESINVPAGDVLDWPVKFIASLTSRSIKDVEDAILCARLKRGRAMDLSYFDGGQHKLVEEAACWQGAANSQHDGNFPAEEVTWRIDTDYDITPFIGLMEGGYPSWVRWFREECEMQVEEGRGGYLELLLENIEEPTVTVELPGDRVDIWDGWHRIGASIVRRAPTVPVLVGDRRLALAPQVTAGASPGM